MSAVRDLQAEEVKFSVAVQQGDSTNYIKIRWIFRKINTFCVFGPQGLLNNKIMRGATSPAGGPSPSRLKGLSNALKPDVLKSPKIVILQ